MTTPYMLRTQTYYAGGHTVVERVELTPETLDATIAELEAANEALKSLPQVQMPSEHVSPPA